MKSNTDLQFTAAADEDIEEVLQYTLETWGARQEAQYRETLRQAFLSIRAFPELGRATASSRERGFILPHHIILYRYEGNSVTILRILNPRRRPR